MREGIVRRVVPVGLMAAAVIAVGAGCSDDAVTATTASTSASAPSSTVATATAGPAESSAASEVMAAMQSVQDQAFLGILKIGAFQYGDLLFGPDAQVVAAARTVCADLRAGSPAAAVISDAAQNYGGDATRGRYFAQQAAQTYCSDRAAALGG
ncbi:DUF732 domain-containing protein [Williamsia sp. SKLECPSW1]